MYKTDAKIMLNFYVLFLYFMSETILGRRQSEIKFMAPDTYRLAEKRVGIKFEEMANEQFNGRCLLKQET
jgi:hypothetical protein